jgi:soluble lytic murein transglycosylase-like protein
VIEMPAERAGLGVAASRMRRRIKCAVCVMGALVCTQGTRAEVIAAVPSKAASPVAASIVAPAAGTAAAASVLAQAVAYENGEGVAKDLRRAAALYCEAAREGNADAQYGLGWMYANGRGMPRDDAVAASLLALAAAAGQPDAAKALRFVGGERGHLPDCMRPAEPDNVDPFARDNTASDPFAALPPWKKQIADVVESLAPKYAVNPRLALAVITVESNFEPRARSDKDARGLMQLVAGTAERFRVADRYDIRENVRGGLAYLQWLLAYYQGQVPLAAAAYNAGEGAVDKYRGIPPYAETRAYVKRVLALYPGETHPYDPRIADPSPILAGPVAGTL